MAVKMRLFNFKSWLSGACKPDYPISFDVYGENGSRGGKSITLQVVVATMDQFTTIDSTGIDLHD